MGLSGPLMYQYSMDFYRKLLDNSGIFHKKTLKISSSGPQLVSDSGQVMISCLLVSQKFLTGALAGLIPADVSKPLLRWTVIMPMWLGRLSSHGPDVRNVVNFIYGIPYKQTHGPTGGIWRFSNRFFEWFSCSWNYNSHFCGVINIIWLLVTGTWMDDFPIYWEYHHPNWLS